MVKYHVLLKQKILYNYKKFLINSLNFKDDLCGEHCPFWAEVKRIYHVETDIDNEESESEKNTLRIVRMINDFDWTQEVTANFKFHGYCQWFEASCLLSCIFGVVWLTLFFMCGRGGYDNSMQVQFKNK